MKMFLYIDPLKQGLKLYIFFNHLENLPQFLYIDPLKQGLKLEASEAMGRAFSVFIHRSIKTRIETEMLLKRQILRQSFYT